MSYVSYIAAICLDPGSIVFGRRTGSAPYHQGGSMTYHCDDDYTMTGDDTLTCQSNGAWDKPTPTCEAPCKALIFLTFQSYVVILDLITMLEKKVLG